MQENTKGYGAATPVFAVLCWLQCSNAASMQEETQRPNRGTAKLHLRSQA
jgi:hypothetical protein